MNSREIQELQELYSEVYEEKFGSPRPTFMPKSRERNIGPHDDWKDKTPTEWGDKTSEQKKADKLKSRASAVVQTQRRQDKETGVKEEVEQVDERINLKTQSSKRKSLGKYKGEYESPKEFRKTEIIDAPYQSKGNYNAHLSKEEFDLFDVVLEHLLAEGYADTEQAAEAIMVNMSEEWRVSIVEAKIEPPKEKVGALININIPQNEREAARQRTLEKAKKMREKGKNKD